MAAISKPNGTRAFANKRVFWVKTIANIAAMTTTELNAVTSIEISQFLYAAGTGKADADVSRAESPRRVGSSTTNESFATVKNTYGDLLYSHDPQGLDSSADNKARQVLAAYEQGYIVEFSGLSAEASDASTAITTGKRYKAQKAQVGPQVDSDTGDDEGAEFAIKQPVSIIGDPTRGTVA